MDGLRRLGEVLHQLTPDNNGSEATWSFEAEPGVYRVGVTWTPHKNRATNAAYTVETYSTSHERSR